jgi:hypothetical protein
MNEMKYVLGFIFLIGTLSSCLNQSKTDDGLYTCYFEKLDSLSLHAEDFIKQNYFSDTLSYKEFSYASNFESGFLSPSEIQVYPQAVYFHSPTLSIEYRLGHTDSLIQTGDSFIAPVNELGEPILQDLPPVLVSYNLVTKQISTQGYYEYFHENDKNDLYLVSYEIPVRFNQELVDSLMQFGIRFHSCFD